jgi:L-iditol 2-dehydrogenase
MPEVLPNEVLIEVSVAAICLTDIYAARGLISCHDGVILGHEFVGRVVKMGQNTCSNKEKNEICVGDRVASMPFIPCGVCNDCKSNLSWQCNQGEILGINRNGGFTQYVTLPLSQVHLIKNSLADEINTFAEPVAAALSVLQAPIEKSQKIWVCGTGRIANLCTFILNEHGYRNVSQSLVPPTKSYDVLVLIQQPEELVQKNSAQNWIKNLSSDGLIVLKTRTPDKLFIPINQLIKKRLRIQAVNYAPIPEALAFIERHATFFNDLRGPFYTLQQHKVAFSEAQRNIEKKVFFEIKSLGLTDSSRA